MKKEKEIKKRIKIRINFFFTKVKKPFLKIKILSTCKYLYRYFFMLR